MDLKLAGRRALVTGGSKGIGAAVARRLAEEGCSLCLVARSQDRLEATAKALRQDYKAEIAIMALDLADAGDRNRLVEQQKEIDILVNNAGAIPQGSIEQIDDPAWRTAWELKVFGYINLTRAYFARMKQRGRGVIVNIIGLGGERLDANYIVGSTGNAALMAFTRALGGASIDHGVRVVGINPGVVDTERAVTLAKAQAQRLHGDESRWPEMRKNLPLGRAATPDEIAATAVFLASDLSAYTTGSIVTIDGGAANRRAG